MSHLGRPKGVEEKYSLKHIVDKVSEILGVQVKFVSDCIGDIAEKATSDLKIGRSFIIGKLTFLQRRRSRR